MTQLAYAVNALLPLTLRPLSAAELAERSGGAPEGPLVEMPRAARRGGEHSEAVDELRDQVVALERKIDVLVELLLRKERKEAERTSALVELSMERVVFRWADVLEVGASFELELVLGLLPPTELRTAVIVEGCTEDVTGEVPGQRVEARFVDLSESAADLLHRYMLTAQRRARRARGAA